MPLLPADDRHPQHHLADRGAGGHGHRRAGLVEEGLLGLPVGVHHGRVDVDDGEDRGVEVVAGVGQRAAAGHDLHHRPAGQPRACTPKLGPGPPNALWS